MVRIKDLKIETLPTIGWDNPSADDDQRDAFGMFYMAGTPHHRNGPSLYDSKFIKDGYIMPDAWVLKKVEFATGASISWRYEPDTWFTSRGDANHPLFGRYKNYYAYYRHRNDNPDAHLCEDNYGGGLRVINAWKCDALGRCFNTNYDYTLYDPELGCYRNSGALDSVPFSTTFLDDIDIRRPGHMGSPYGTGSLFYNKVTTREAGKHIYTDYYYFTVDSTPKNTHGATDVPMEDEFGNISVRNYDELGGYANTPQPWKRGQEYLIRSYSDDKSLGDNGLLYEISRAFKSREHLRIYMGDEVISTTDPLRLVPVKKNFSSSHLAPHTFDLGMVGQFYGFSSGSLFVKNATIKEYDMMSKSYSEKTVKMDYYNYSGLLKSLTTTDGEKTRIALTKYAYQRYPEMKKKNMLKAPYEMITYNGGIGDGNAVEATTYIYNDFGSNPNPLNMNWDSLIWNIPPENLNP